MADQEQRELERADDVESAAEALRQRVRRGELDHWRVQLAAFCRYSPANVALGGDSLEEAWSFSALQELAKNAPSLGDAPPPPGRPVAYGWGLPASVSATVPAYVALLSVVDLLPPDVAELRGVRWWLCEMRWNLGGGDSPIVTDGPWGIEEVEGIARERLEEAQRARRAAGAKPPARNAEAAAWFAARAFHGASKGFNCQSMLWVGKQAANALVALEVGNEEDPALLASRPEVAVRRAEEIRSELVRGMLSSLRRWLLEEDYRLPIPPGYEGWPDDHRRSMA